MPELKDPATIHHFPILKYFGYAHLPENLQEISKPFCDTAIEMVNNIPTGVNSAEMAAGLRKLLEAKDCFVRAKLP